MRSTIKVGMLAMLVFASSQARAFNVLSCSGDIDVRLKGPHVKKERFARSFTIKRTDALELDLSVDGWRIGRLFPWDHVVWEKAASLKTFKDVTFKTDDATTISLTLYDLVHKKTHSLSCAFRFD
jgi:hypothetical protein